MKVQIVAGLMAVVALTACESRYNPGNWGWFGGSSSSEPTLAPSKGYNNDVELRPLVDQVTALTVERTVGGAIVTAVGLPATQGYFDAELVSTYESVVGNPAAKDGIMRFEFRTFPPPRPHGVVNVVSREVTAGAFLSDQTLRNVRQIVVVGSRNQRSSSR